MKKVWVLALLALFLTGCGEAEVFETVMDEAVQTVMTEPRQVQLILPEEAVLPAMETDSGTLYMCREFDVSVQTLESGDMEETIRQVSGYNPEELTVITTVSGGVDCHEFVWTATAEAGEQVCRCMILDDGNYHYILTAMTDSELVQEYQEIWNGMFESFCLR